MPTDKHIPDPDDPQGDAFGELARRGFDSMPNVEQEIRLQRLRTKIAAKSEAAQLHNESAQRAQMARVRTFPNNPNRFARRKSLWLALAASVLLILTAGSILWIRDGMSSSEPIAQTLHNPEQDAEQGAEQMTAPTGDAAVTTQSAATEAYIESASAKTPDATASAKTQGTAGSASRFQKPASSTSPNEKLPTPAPAGTASSPNEKLPTTTPGRASRYQRPASSTSPNEKLPTPETGFTDEAKREAEADYSPAPAPDRVASGNSVYRDETDATPPSNTAPAPVSASPSSARTRVAAPAHAQTSSPLAPINAEFENYLARLQPSANRASTTRTEIEFAIDSQGRVSQMLSTPNAQLSATQIDRALALLQAAPTWPDSYRNKRWRYALPLD